MNTPLPPVSSFAMSATGPDGRGAVVAVDADVVVLAVDVPLLLLEHAASATSAPTATLTVNGLLCLRSSGADRRPGRWATPHGCSRAEGRSRMKMNPLRITAR